MAGLMRCLRQPSPGFLAAQYLVNLNSGHELHPRRILPQPAVPHLAHQAAVLKLDVDAGSRREVARADETQTAFGDVQHAAGSIFEARAAHRADLHGLIDCEAGMPPWFELVHATIIGSSNNSLYTR